MPIFFFISGYLIRRYIDSVPWENYLDKCIWNIFWVPVLWGVVQWLALSTLNQWLALERNLSNASNTAYADSTGELLHGMITASTSLWYLYVLTVYFVICEISNHLALPSFILLILMSAAANFVSTPWWGMNNVSHNSPYYSLGAWLSAILMTRVKAVSLRCHLLIASLLIVLAVGAWLFNISLLLSLVSIVVIMKLFYRYEQRFSMRPTSLLSMIGSNTIAIYATHRILVEIFSLTPLVQVNVTRRSPQVEPALLLVYPSVSLLTCTVTGLLVRKLLQCTFSDLLSPPSSLPAAVSYSRQAIAPTRAIQFAKLR